MKLTKIIAFILTLTMLIGIMPTTVLAKDGTQDHTIISESDPPEDDTHEDDFFDDEPDGNIEDELNGDQNNELDNLTNESYCTGEQPDLASMSSGGVSELAIGRDFTLAIRTDGSLWAWGRNEEGQLGDGTTTDRHAPVQIQPGTTWSSVAAGMFHTLAIKSDGTLWAWGSNYRGQLGDGTTITRHTPVQIQPGTTWKCISAWRTPPPRPMTRPTKPKTGRTGKRRAATSSCTVRVLKTRRPVSARSAARPGTAGWPRPA